MYEIKIGASANQRGTEAKIKAINAEKMGTP
jgi:hypothetical protein